MFSEIMYKVQNANFNSHQCFSGRLTRLQGCEWTKKKKPSRLQDFIQRFQSKRLSADKLRSQRAISQY